MKTSRKKRAITKAQPTDSHPPDTTEPVVKTDVGRREFLQLSLAAGVGLAAPTIFTRKASAQTERVLKVVQWKHFVPDYDKK